ncbi:Aste57867_17600 [Aphanomyces stellatus]|uniref:Aste57867_17600 protein n=1 Tax=Aphanomyces stellatus TaxID=120398 RepID=A0A485L8T7_9STRA|nr:hypothetical protein As57867_017540 [Aphanomyces stellatus]VFT94351.1 Aste57867_17600 [Aphanomyces stellatus]
MQVIEVVAFAAARVQELHEIHEASGYETHAKMRMERRRKDFHLRRRTNAYNSHKFPARFRGKPPRVPSSPDGGSDRCRKHRRRAMLKAKTDRLPTHNWLVKRMKMGTINGVAVPLHRLDHSVSAALAAPATVCDTSFLSLVELCGPKDDVLEVLDACIDDDGLDDDVVGGAVEGHVVLYHADAFPMRAIGPARVLCHGDTLFQLWLWVDPRMTADVLATFTTVASPSVRIAPRSLCRFEVRGVESARIMDTVFHDHTPLEWQAASSDDARVIQTWHFQDPRMRRRRAPRHMTSSLSLLSPAPDDTPSSRCPITNSAFATPEPDLAALNARFASVLQWASSVSERVDYSSCVAVEPVANSAAAAVARPASDNRATESLLWDAVPPPPFTPDHVVNAESGVALPSFPSLTVQRQDGWDLVVWPAYAPTLLKAMVFAGASAIGLVERDALRTRRGVLNFPRDYPDTASGRAFWVDHAATETAISLAKPKAKRVAYGALLVASPFSPNWQLLFPSSGNDDDASTGFCILRGAAYMDPFPFYHPQAKVGASTIVLVGIPHFIIKELKAVPVAMPTLICVHVALPRRGNMDPNAMLCFPSQADVDAFESDPSWQGDVELTAKQAKKQPHYEMRSIMGFVTSVVQESGVATAVGFCHCEALQNLFLLQQARATPGLVLLRNPTTRQYRPALVTVR